MINKLRYICVVLSTENKLAIKYIVNMWEMFIFAVLSVIILSKILYFLYHDIPVPFVYITIIMRF